MKRMATRSGGRTLAAVVMTLGLSAIHTPVGAQGRSIEGVWGLSITIRDCACLARKGGVVYKEPAIPIGRGYRMPQKSRDRSTLNCQVPLRSPFATSKRTRSKNGCSATPTLG